VIRIAAVGPLTGPAAVRGRDLEKAAQMAVDEANAAGGVNGHTFRLSVYDDGDQPERAKTLARQIADSPAIAVLGQVASSAAFAAGQVYREKGIPAITGAASESHVTAGNDWYFRLFQDAGGQGRYLADYALYGYKAQCLAVVIERGTAGEEFASALRERAREERMEIARDVEFKPAEAADDTILNQMAAKLAGLPKGCIVVLGTQFAETPAVLGVLRDRLGPFLALGYSSVATQALATGLATREHERRLPAGYYTDGFTVAAPQLGDIAGYAQTLFANRYKARYGSEPTPEAVRWYEGARLIFQAVANKGIDGTDQQADRRRVRDWLASLDQPQSAAEGVAGPIYFDSGHNADRAISVGEFYKGRLQSAPLQLLAVPDAETVPGWEQLVSSGSVIDTSEGKLVKTPVVYVGIDLNKVENIDVRANTFGADFFLWFRYQDDLNLASHDVEFPTAVSGAGLGKEMARNSHGGFTTVTYHVQGTFRCNYEFSRFPFDSQMLRIPVQFHDSDSYTMILAHSPRTREPAALASASGMVDTGEPESILGSKLWKLKDVIFFRDVVAYQSSFGDEWSAARVEVNRMNAAIRIRRDVFGFAIKNFLPLVCVFVAVMIGYVLSPDVVVPRVSLGITALLTTTVLYQKLGVDLPTVTYITGLDYVFFAFFFLCVLFLILSVVAFETHKRKHQGLSAILNRIGATLSVVNLGLTLAFVWVRYWRLG
jgi:branched-chain amino acid transport system substrate-binding protein